MSSTSLHGHCGWHGLKLLRIIFGRLAWPKGQEQGHYVCVYKRLPFTLRLFTSRPALKGLFINGPVYKRFITPIIYQPAM